MTCRLLTISRNPRSEFGLPCQCSFFHGCKDKRTGKYQGEFIWELVPGPLLNSCSFIHSKEVLHLAIATYKELAILVYSKTAISNSSQKFSDLFLGGGSWDLQYGCHAGLGQQLFSFSQLIS